MLNWSEKFETGNAVIDSQHRMFISYVNRLEELSRSRNPVKEEVELFFRFMDFLEDYMAIHFAEEENCMLHHQCGAYKENLIAHNEFLDFFKVFKHQIEIEGYRLESVRELYDACVAWIQRHILRLDVQLKPCRTPYDEPGELANEVQSGSDAITFLEYFANQAGPRPRVD